MNQNTNELWRPVVAFPTYEVSNLGRVRNAVTGLVLKQRLNKDGIHMFVTLGPHSKRQVKTVHRLVGEAFIGPLPPGLETCHNDGNGLNNMLTNLRYDTALSNNADRKRHGTDNAGERNGRAKLTPADVLRIRASLEGAKKTALAFGVSPRTVRDIKDLNSWSHI